MLSIGMLSIGSRGRECRPFPLPLPAFSRRVHFTI